MDTSPTNSNARQDLIVYSHQLHHLNVCFVLAWEWTTKSSRNDRCSKNILVYQRRNSPAKTLSTT